MSKEELITALREIAARQLEPVHVGKLVGTRKDMEKDHEAADRLLLEYINDPRVTTLFDQIDKWYV